MDHMTAIDKCVDAFVKRGVPVDRDELAGAARVGYTRALSSFKEGQGCAFSTWAWTAMWGAMVDECRRLDPHTRRQRAQIASGEIPTTHKGREVPVITITELREEMYGNRDIASAVAARLDLLAALRSLPRRLGSIMLWRAFGYSQKEIARALGLTESRVCQLEGDARRRVARFA